MPLDILLPFWGDPAMLKETVRSVLAQTSGDWVLTVVDDAYPDSSVGEYFARLDDARVTYLRHEKNVGITENYRRCVTLATHDVVVLLGCDDVLLPRYVEVVLEAHRQFPEAAVIQPGVQVIDENGTVVRTLVDSVKQRLAMPRGRGRRLVRGELLAASLLRADWLYWPSLAFRREALVSTGFRDGLPIIQDLALVVDVVAAGGSLLLEPEICFSYRRHSASASSAKLLDGSRFVGEQEYFTMAARQMAGLGWRRASRAARWHLTSRLHALTLVPRTVATGNRAAVAVLAGHVFGRMPRTV
ncbi:MAG: glycosyltransferase [Cellulomonas sp.]|uniref:glycosyltransferase family 2 protein n=1 Tax=Cellulomonas sp. TaxID=40001 RepID=UPI001846FA5D|nr:glycosyltransferase family 2 protein [Cellulomonas sp.]NMM32331.1 glycosyltransferase [Cellulomonas sp.]